MHLVPTSIEVIWTLDVERRDTTTAVFRCTVETRIPTLLALFATVGLLPLFLRWHVEGDTALRQGHRPEDGRGSARQCRMTSQICSDRIRIGHGRRRVPGLATTRLSVDGSIVRRSAGVATLVLVGPQRIVPMAPPSLPHGWDLSF